MDTSQDMTLCLNYSVMLLIIIQQFLGIEEYSILDIFWQRFVSVMDLTDSGKEETLNSHWAALFVFGLCMKINKCISSSSSPVVQFLRVLNGLYCHKYK